MDTGDRAKLELVSHLCMKDPACQMHEQSSDQSYSTTYDRTACSHRRLSAHMGPQQVAALGKQRR